jgi:hypothetical protein
MPDFQLPEDPFWYRLGAGGLILFVIAWAWSLLTGLSLFRR